MDAATSVLSTASDPSIPPSHGRCLFFELPAESRNAIYEYALTSKDGLVCRSEDNKLFTYHALRNGEPDNTDFNQLQFVSRQLHAEIKGMVLSPRHYLQV
jgi:hypothetical protein